MTCTLAVGDTRSTRKGHTPPQGGEEATMSVSSFEPKGNYIDGQWVMPSDTSSISSINPADSSQVVLRAPTSPDYV